MMMTNRQIQMLANFIASIRGDWDSAGIAAALHRTAAERDQVNAADIAHAAIRAATTATNRTPGVIPLAGPHWENPTAKSGYYGAPMLARCPTCGWHHHPDEGHYRRQQHQDLAF